MESINKLERQFSFHGEAAVSLLKYISNFFDADEMGFITGQEAHIKRVGAMFLVAQRLAVLNQAVTGSVQPDRIMMSQQKESVFEGLHFVVLTAGIINNPALKAWKDELGKKNITMSHVHVGMEINNILMVEYVTRVDDQEVSRYCPSTASGFGKNKVTPLAEYAYVARSLPGVSEVLRKTSGDKKTVNLLCFSQRMLTLFEATKGVPTLSEFPYQLGYDPSAMSFYAVGDPS